VICAKKLCLKRPFNGMDSFAGEQNTKRTKKTFRKLHLRDQTMLKEERDWKTLTGSDRRRVSTGTLARLSRVVGSSCPSSGTADDAKN
jgi:hypothetical protein